MQKETLTIIKLSAEPGKILTNGENYGTEIYLNEGEPAENWHEITQEEYIQQIEEKAKLLDIEDTTGA